MVKILFLLLPDRGVPNADGFLQIQREYLFDQRHIPCAERLAEGVQSRSVFPCFLLKPGQNLLRKDNAALLVGNDKFVGILRYTVEQRRDGLPNSKTVIQG